MVKEGQRSKQIIKIHPKKISEITEGKYDKFMIKFGASYCGPCKELSLFLDKSGLDLKADVPVYIVQLDEDQNEIAESLSEFFEFNSIPYCVVSDKSLTILDEVLGFDKKTLTSFIERNFK